MDECPGCNYVFEDDELDARLNTEFNCPGCGVLLSVVRTNEGPWPVLVQPEDQRLRAMNQPELAGME